MISDKDVDESLHFLLDNTEKIAKAESTLADLEERKDVELAVLAAGCNDGNYNIQRRHGLAQPRYAEHLTKMEVARLAFAELKYKWQAHEKRISVWQSQNKREQGPRP
jgi:hypothetical protein